MPARRRSYGLPIQASGWFLVALCSLTPVAAQATAPPTARVQVVVSDVVIQGNRRVSTEAIRNHLKTQVGQEYVPEVLQDDVRNLFATRQFGNVWADKQDDGTGKVRIIIHIRDYPNLVNKVTYQGNRVISKDDLDTATNIRPSTPLNPIANKVACQAIVRKYQEEGRPFASCNLIKGADPADTEVIFNITEGPITRVRKVGFTGNNFVSSGVLRNRVSTRAKTSCIGGKFNPALTETDVHELRQYYRSFGFDNVRVNRELRYSADGREVSVIFHIQEGIRYQRNDQPHEGGARGTAGEALEAMCSGELQFGVGVNTSTGLTGSIIVNERNFDLAWRPSSFYELISRRFQGAGQEFRLEGMPGER